MNKVPFNKLFVTERSCPSSLLARVSSLGGIAHASCGTCNEIPAFFPQSTALHDTEDSDLYALDYICIAHL